MDARVDLHQPDRSDGRHRVLAPPGFGDENRREKERVDSGLSMRCPESLRVPLRFPLGVLYFPRRHRFLQFSLRGFEERFPFEKRVDRPSVFSHFPFRFRNFPVDFLLNQKVSGNERSSPRPLHLPFRYFKKRAPKGVRRQSAVGDKKLFRERVRGRTKKRGRIDRLSGREKNGVAAGYPQIDFFLV